MLHGIACLPLGVACLLAPSGTVLAGASVMSVAFGGIHAIDFHGRLVDQHAKPVAGATIFFTGTNKLFASGAGSGTVRTDDHGNFHIGTRGNRLQIRQISHPEIEAFNFPRPRGWEMGATKLRSRHEAITFQRQAPQHVFDRRSWKNTDRDRPFVFIAWRRTDPVELVRGKTRVRLMPDGKAVSVALKGVAKARFRARKKLEPTAPVEHLQISCRREPLGESRERGSWQIEMRAIDGGLIAVADDLYLNRPPRQGYRAVVVAGNSRGEPDYAPTLLNQRFYFRANGARQVGSLYIHFDPYLWKDHCAVDIEFKINPRGEYNLEAADEAAAGSRPEIVR
ncbi:MAG: hypothetical protein KDG52_13825 [Rhodocyclaceae bacterium]|nr:hypothetical protein [Rhodocyclaceae bacterium]